MCFNRNKVKAKHFRRAWWLSWQSGDFPISGEVLWLEMGGKLFPLFLSILSPNQNSAVFKKIAKPAFVFWFGMLYLVPSLLFPLLC